MTTTAAGDDLVSRIVPILREAPELAAVWLFGSMARGDAGPESDIDLGVLFRKRGDTALDHHRSLRTIAARVEQAAAGRRVDIVVLEAQGWNFRHRVLREGRLIYDADRDRRVDFVSTTIVRYLDFRPTYDIAARHALAGVRQRLERRP